MKKQLKKIFFLLTLLFAALFVFRFIYGYTVTPNSYSAYDNQFFVSASSAKKNYASKQHVVKSQAHTSTINVDQKYEKIAEINTQSSTFEKEEKQVREAITHFRGLTQFEQKSGNTGYRHLNLLIGVPPENFDALYQRLITIGKVRTKQITKTDKTNEYKALNAKKASLEKMRAALIELKSKGGKIQDFMALETRLLEIEEQLQTLGVSLGDFDAENEFCTVQFSLNEGREVTISLLHRVKVALQWSIKYFLALMVAFFFATLFAYLLVLLIDKLKIFERLLSEKA